MDTTHDYPVSVTRPGWARWSALGAVIWSAVYGCLGSWWLSHPEGFPFGVGPLSGSAASALAGLRPETGAPLAAVMGYMGAVVALLMWLSRPQGVARAGLLAFAVGMTACLLLLVPDARALIAAAYAPIFLLGAPFDWPPVSFSEAIPWPVVNQYVCIIGGFLWGGTALAFFRLTRGACIACGGAAVSRWTSTVAARQWGMWGASVAVVAPLVYATTRLAWVFGIPLGISDALFHEVQSTGMWGAAVGLSSVAISGAVLTLGLVRRWGEVFPGWMPVVGGRRVPLALAVVPASAVSVLVFAAGLGVVREALRNGVPAADWLAHAPGFLWPLWGMGLGAATLAYYYRRREPCSSCGGVPRPS